MQAEKMAIYFWVAVTVAVGTLNVIASLYEQWIGQSQWVRSAIYLTFS